MQIYAMEISDIEFELPTSFYVGKLAEFSPIGRIPILETDEGIIPESEVIAEYLDDLYPDKALLGSSPKIRADVRLVSRIADIYLMNNIFMALPQVPRATRNDAIRDLLILQVTRGIGALDKHLGDGEFAVGDKLTRADCSLVPALWMCEKTVPRFDVANPMLGTKKVAAYWAKIQTNPHAAKVIEEMNQGLQRRMDGTEKMRIQEALATQKA